MVRLRLLSLGLGLALIAVAAPRSATAAGPASSVAFSATPAVNTVTYTGTAPFNNNQDGLVYGQLGIDDPKNSCGTANTTLNDQHMVAVTVPSIPSKYDVLLRFQIDWVPAGGQEPLSDMALYVYDPKGKLVGTSDGSQTQESVNLAQAIPGTYDALVCSFQTGPTGQAYTGKVSAFTTASGTFPTATGVTAPTFAQFSAPADTADSAGEPSIGNSWVSGATFFTANTSEYKVDFNDAKKSSTWTLVNNKITDPTNVISLDPIGFTDSVTGRTFVSQLLFATSGAEFTDDDFTNTTPSEGGGTGINGFDHQTFGGGPYPAGMSSLDGYAHAVYYCSQAQALVLGSATCARSDTGGLVFNPPVNTYNGECNGLHGHVRVAPDGTVYLPNANCGGKQGFAVSTDAGQTWAVRTVPDSLSGGSDPSVGIGSDGTVYLGWSDGTGQPKVAVSRDRGKTWAPSINAGIPFGIHNTEFAEVMAGDGDRAAFAFLGTPTQGSSQAADFGYSADGKTFTGAEWHTYVSYTYDRGKTWTTVDATPADAVQRGCIWNSGGSNPCRNLLDFNDITIDKTGRVMVGYADGCTATCVTSAKVGDNKLVSHGAILRQETGKTLFAKYDTAAGTPSTTKAKSPAVTHKPTVKKPTVKAVTPATGSLAATGGTPLLPILGVALLGLALVPRRRGLRRT